MPINEVIYNNRITGKSKYSKDIPVGSTFTANRVGAFGEVNRGLYLKTVEGVIVLNGDIWDVGGVVFPEAKFNNYREVDVSLTVSIRGE